MRLLITIFFFFTAVGLFAQDGLSEQVKVKIIARDSTDNRLIENAQVISFESLHIFATDEKGVFRGSFNASDSLKIFGLGYNPVVLQVSKFKDHQDGIVIHLSRKVYMMETIEVSTRDMHLHLPRDISQEKNNTPMGLRSDTYSGKPPVIAAVVNPLSYISYHTSKTEKEKRKVLNVMAQDETQKVIDEFYNKEVVRQVSGYEGDLLDNFMVFCNINLKLNIHSNPIIVREQIADLKVKFEEKQKVKQESKQREKKK